MRGIVPDVGRGGPDGTRTGRRTPTASRDAPGGVSRSCFRAEKGGSATLRGGPSSGLGYTGRGDLPGVRPLGGSPLTLDDSVRGDDGSTGTDLRNGVNFDHQDGSAIGG